MHSSQRVDMSVEKFREDFDWREAFDRSMDKLSTVITQPDVSLDKFDTENVVYIHALREGENDGAEWLAVVTLDDGRDAFVSAWCDYTGWGCQDGGIAYVARSVEELVRFAMTPEERKVLGFPAVY